MGPTAASGGGGATFRGATEASPVGLFSFVVIGGLLVMRDGLRGRKAARKKAVMERKREAARERKRKAGMEKRRKAGMEKKRKAGMEKRRKAARERKRKAGMEKRGSRRAGTAFVCAKRRHTGIYVGISVGIHLGIHVGIYLGIYEGIYLGSMRGSIWDPFGIYLGMWS